MSNKIKPRNRIKVQADIELFWNSVLSPIVAEGLFDGKHLVHEIVLEFRKLRDEVQARYKEPLEVKLNPWFEKGIRGILAGCGVNNDRPFLSIMVRGQQELYRILETKKEPHWEIKFRNSVEIGIFHEMYHLANGHVGPNRMANEVYAWADTCRGILGYHIMQGSPLVEHDLSVWRNWIESDKDKDGARWRAYIEKTYAGVY